MDKSDRSGSLNQNYIKIESILSRAAQTLRRVFRSRWKEESLSEWTDSPVQGANFIAGIGKKAYNISGKTQKECIKNGDIEFWDITILTNVLLNFASSKQNSEEQKHEQQLLRTLKEVRNKFAHHSTKNIKDEEMKSLWNDTESVLLHFGDTQKGIQSFYKLFRESVFSESTPEINKTNTKTALKLKTQAKKLHSDGKFHEAIQIYTEAIILSGLADAEMAELYCNRSTAYLKQYESYKQKVNNSKHSSLVNAVSDAKAAVKHNPNGYKGFFCLGMVYMTMGKLEKALKNYESALALEPLQQELKEARDACALKVGGLTWAEHLDPFSQVATQEESLQKFNELTGLNLSMPRVDESLSSVIPGYADVQKANAYRSGVEDGVFQNYELAVQLYAKAAAMGNIEGIVNLGQMYMQGHGVKQDLKKAIQLYREAADKTNDGASDRTEIAVAEHSLGVSYYLGLGVPKDESQAVMWYKKSSDNGFSPATNNLARLYAEGRGVPRDLDKALQYWKLAASAKDSLAMQSLAQHYLTVDNDATEARKWFKRSIQNGNFTAKLNEAEFEIEAKKVESQQSEFVKKMQDWERESKLECTGMTLRARRIRYLNQKGNPEIEALRLQDAMKNIGRKGQQTTPGTTCKSFNDFDYVMLQQYAASGSATARRMLEALDHYSKAMLMLMGENNTKESSSQMLYHLAEACKIESVVVQLIVKFEPILNGIIKECMAQAKKCEYEALEINARICYAHVNANDVQHVLDFLKPCMKLYPKEKFFYVLSCSLYAFLGNSADGARLSSESLERFTTDCKLLYGKASHLRLQSSNQQLIIKAYEEYLTHAPIDDRTRPDAFYGIGLAYYAMSKHKVKPGKPLPTNISKAEEFYQKGLEAEKHQLPCFMPCKSTNKSVLENRLELIKVNLPKSRTAAQLTEAVQVQGLENQQSLQHAPKMEVLTDLSRVSAVISHRTAYNSLMELVGFPSASGIQLTANSRHRRRRPQSLIGLTKITLNDMDPTIDHVYADSILHVTSIEPAVAGVMPSIRLLVQDSNMSVIRAAIYNFHTTDEHKIQKALGVGATLSIINPYMRQAADGQFGIRVDDIKCLKLESPSREKYCRFCGQDAEFKCNRCGKAKYCNHECQINDWKLMKHKLICVKQ